MEMPMKAFLPLLLVLTACLENEEEITVHPDGSLTVRVAAEGDASDFTQGFPLPTAPGFAPIGDATASWLARVGPLSGGSAARERLDTGAWIDASGAPIEKGRLGVEGHFASAAELPATFAPESEPHATAFLERSTSLDVQEKGGRRVFVFERVYGRRPELTTFLEGLEELDAHVPERVMERLRLEGEGQPSLDDRDWDVLTRQVRRLFLESTERIVDGTLLALYTQGDASLSVSARERVRSATLERVSAGVTVDSLRGVLDQLRALDLEEETVTVPKGPNPLEALEADVRDSLREGLHAALEAESLDSSVQGAVLRTLEWHFAALDQTSDLDDETFELEVHMPGTIVGGNYATCIGGRAHFEFEGKALREREVRLRVVSVLE
jgi:hypothetical protein